MNVRALDSCVPSLPFYRRDIHLNLFIPQKSPKSTHFIVDSCTDPTCTYTTHTTSSLSLRHLLVFFVSNTAGVEGTFPSYTHIHSVKESFNIIGLWRYNNQLETKKPIHPKAIQHTQQCTKRSGNSRHKWVNALLHGDSTFFVLHIAIRLLCTC